MNIFYEEEGSFKVGSILADNTTSLQVENIHGKRSKIKSANVMLRFAQPSLSAFMAQAETLAAQIDIAFLWESCPPEEFGFDMLAHEYFGHPPAPDEAAALLISLHTAPMYFYKKGKGRFKAAPAEALQAALAGAEKKRQQAALQARYTDALIAFELPPEFAPALSMLLYAPDRNTLEVKALEAACAATHLSAANLLQKCGAIPSSHDFHVNKFLFENFPKGIGFPDITVGTLPDLPLSPARAFSIDDATTTEIDDAFSVEKISDECWRIGIHIAAPALGITAGSPLDAIAAQRLSTVYMPGKKITMLPGSVVQTFTLSADNICPALSLYLDINAADLAIVRSESRVERLHIAANLRHDTLEPLFNETSLAAGKTDYPYAPELKLLWEFANTLEALRGKAGENNTQIDYNFYVENDRVTITNRQRGSPIDKVVAELMILVNSTWGKLLADHDIPGIYRTQNNGKVKMSTVAAPHQGLGVAQYMWSSSPLRRYVDLINQRQIIQLLLAEPPAYARNDPALFTVLRDFDAAYTIYADFQRQMERYWCLRWLQQEAITQCEATVLRENLIRFDRLPLVTRLSSLPDLPASTRILLEVHEPDWLALTFNGRYLSTLDTAETAEE